LIEEALDCTALGIRFGRCYGPLVRQAKIMSEFAIIVVQYELRHMSCISFVAYKIVFRRLMDLLLTSHFQSPITFIGRPMHSIV